MKRLKQEILSLLKKENKTFWGILKELSYSVIEVIEELNELHKEGLVETANDLISLTEKGISFTEKNHILKAMEWNKEFQEKLLEKFNNSVKNRPFASKEFDQGFIKPENSVERATIMGKNFDADSKNILIIGDDDLVSIALALTERTKKIVVLEADQRLNDFINEFAEENGFPLKALTWSVEEEIPAEFKKQFDVFLTDPVETSEGIKLFLGRGINSLKGTGSAFYFGLTSLEAGKIKWHKIQSMLLNSGFIFTDIIKDQAFYPIEQFQSYPSGAGKIPKNASEFPIPNAKETYFRSSFFRCLAVKEIQPLIKGKVELSDKTFFDEEIF
ncbi:bis-aminopropyl spermidine synthase family protein [Candidatus Micrarchaeota archaeon]|nr:bis-aminopropyl spermidine synthase family protein [Candidatus Micrarchaeota archaeon]MBU2476532.1 bis-aminopropyl spermidine synthase family protein [Candidatus Micrarchaeota archaeon]